MWCDSNHFAFKFNCVVVAVETGLFKSLVLFTLLNPIIFFVIPVQVLLLIEYSRPSIIIVPVQVLLLIEYSAPLICVCMVVIVGVLSFLTLPDHPILQYH